MAALRVSPVVAFSVAWTDPAPHAPSPRNGNNLAS
jgi:hypothetical protein